MARNNEPAFRRKTPLLICSMRTEIPYPCVGSRANVFRMSISRVPWTRSLGLSAINVLPLGCQEEHTPALLLVVKGRLGTGLSAETVGEVGQTAELKRKKRGRARSVASRVGS